MRAAIRIAARASACALLVIVCAGASCTRTVRVAVPGPVEYRDRLVVQPIDARLLQPHPIAAGALSACPDIARARRAELDACNADKSAIRAAQMEPPQ